MVLAMAVCWVNSFSVVGCEGIDLFRQWRRRFQDGTGHALCILIEDFRDQRQL